MRNNLTKKEVKEVPTFELTMRFNRLMLKGELLPARKITIADARETIWIEDELRERLIKQLGHDPYPPDRIEKKHPSNYMISLLKSKQSKPEASPGIKIKFKITIISSIGSKAAEKDVHVDSRGEADLLANKMIRDLGLKKATYKIS